MDMTLAWARHYGRAPAGCQATLSDVFVQGKHYSLVAGISIDGYVVADVVKGLFDGDLFYDFISEKLVCVTQDIPLWMSRTKITLRRNSWRVATSQDNNSEVLRARNSKGQGDL